MAINKKNIKKWIAALASGRYKKCEDNLYKNGAYCALGVGIDVYEKATGEKLTETKEDWSAFEGQLPMKVYKWYGLNDPNPEITVIKNKREISNTITELNDCKRVSFKKFAEGFKNTFGIK